MFVCLRITLDWKETLLPLVANGGKQQLWFALDGYLAVLEEKSLQHTQNAKNARGKKVVDFGMLTMYQQHPPSLSGFPHFLSAL